MMKIAHLLVFLVLAALAAATVPAEVRAEGWGNLSGQFVLQGDVPEPVVVVKQGDATAKDPEVCAAQTLYKDDLVVDPETKGIANIFVYIRRINDVHPDLKESAEKEVVFDQKNCQFQPHALFVRTDQTVLVKSSDPIQHNTHTYPILNMGKNVTIAANDQKGEPYPLSRRESIPFQVKCDIHPWMLAYWLVLDHPYAAITDAQGRFTIEKLPAGEHTFVIYHERTGYLFNKNLKDARFPEFKKDFKVTITADETLELDPIAIPVARFEQ